MEVEEEEGGADLLEALELFVPGMAIPRAAKLTLFFLVCMLTVAWEGTRGQQLMNTNNGRGRIQDDGGIACAEGKDADEAKKQEGMRWENQREMRVQRLGRCG